MSLLPEVNLRDGISVLPKPQFCKSFHLFAPLQIEKKEIDFLQLLEQLAKMGLEGSKFICEKVKMCQEMNEINETLLDKIGELKDIVWMVNSKLKSEKNSS